jgi:hypothetical protein
MLPEVCTLKSAYHPTVALLHDTGMAGYAAVLDLTSETFTRYRRATPKRPGDMAATGRAFGLPSDSPVCYRNRPRPMWARASLGNRRISSRAFGWKIRDRSFHMYQI